MMSSAPSQDDINEFAGKPYDGATATDKQKEYLESLAPEGLRNSVIDWKLGALAVKQGDADREDRINASNLQLFYHKMAGKSKVHMTSVSTGTGSANSSETQGRK
jgi:hypothetical protein